MRLNPTVNSVLNDIMAGESTAVLLFAPDKYNKVDFVTELSSRYFKSFCFSAKTDDLYELCVTLAERVLFDDQELRLKLRQLLFCHSRYNGAKTVINTILDRISSYKREVLIVFEDMECLPNDYDYTLLLYMIKHAPSNLKILLSSDQFLSIGLFGFEPKYPMLVDESVLSDNLSLFTYDEYISDLTDEQIAFMTFITDEDVVSEKLVNKIDSEGVGVLKYLSRKGVYVTSRERPNNNDLIFKFNAGFREYLKGIKASYEAYLTKYEKVDLKAVTIETINEEGGNLFEILTYAYYNNDTSLIEETVERIFHCAKHLPRMFNYLKAHVDLLKIEPLDYLVDYPYIQTFQNLLFITQSHETNATLPRLKALKERFKDSDRTTYFIISAMECLAYDRASNDEKVKELLMEAEEFAVENEDYKYVAFIIKMFLPSSTRYLTYKPQELEAILEKDDVKTYFWYLKILEDLEFSYFANGNYKKCMIYAERLKAELKSYVIPPRHVAMIYYDNVDMDFVEKKVDEALTYALENDLQEDIHMLYMAKSLVYAYRGEQKKSVEFSNLSLSKIGKEDSYEKFFTIMERVWQHAKAGEHKYAHDLANVYLHYTRAKAPEYTQYMATALAYALYKMGRTEDSYQLAKEAIQVGSSRSIAWLMSMGIVTNYVLSKGDGQDVDTLLSNLIKASDTHGMKMLIVDYANDVFAPILGYAQERNVETKRIDELMHAVYLKDGDKQVSAEVMIKMFGAVSITAGGKEIQWKTRKAKDLFMHYVLAGKVGMERSVLLDLLWKDYLYESAINNLKTTNNIIRKTLDSYGVSYKLNYINSRYSITIDEVDNEYIRFRGLVENFNRESDYLNKAEIMDQILKIYRADLCTDINYPEFEHERTSVKQELVINMIKLIRGLAKSGEYVESKRFLNSLMLIDTDNDYNHMVYELDKFINLTK